MSFRGHVAYAVDERVLCWHQDLVYEAKVLEVRRDSETPEYYVHYKGWKNTYVERAFSYVVLGRSSTTRGRILIAERGYVFISWLLFTV